MEKRFLIGFLTFSILILFILLGILVYRDYINKYDKLNSQVNKEAYIEKEIVQSDVKEAEREEIVENVVYYENSQDIQEENVYTQELCNNLKEEPIQETEAINYDNLIINSANYNRNFVNALIKQLSYIPSEILADFDNQGWKICIVSEDEMYEKLGKHEAQIAGDFTKGYTKIEPKIIYITYHSMTLRDNTIIHEIGHYYDITNGWISSTEEYINIFEKEKDSLNCKNTDISMSRELFAETFEYVILEEEEYKDLETYKYVENIIYHD